MATTIDEKQYYSAPPDTVFEMLSDSEFITAKCLASGSIEADAESTTDGDTRIIKSRRVLPAKIPAFARRFVGDTVTLTETQRWAPPVDGTRRASFEVDFGNNPISFSGHIALTAEGEGTEVATVGTIKCSVPFVSGKIEGVALDWITRYLVKEQKVGNAWLEGDR